jgi:hypothetical protein
MKTSTDEEDSSNLMSLLNLLIQSNENIVAMWFLASCLHFCF